MTPAQFIDANSNLLRQIASYDDREQREGIDRIRRLGREQGSSVTLYILSDRSLEDHRVRVVLACLLAEWKHPAAIDHLFSILKVQDEGAVRRAADGLAIFGDQPKVVQELAGMLSNDAPSERLTAAEILSRCASPLVPGIFADRFAAEPAASVRGLYLITLIRSRDPRRKEVLVEALADPDDAIREEAWRALRRYPDLPPGMAYDPGAPPEDRAADVARLKMWLRAATPRRSA